MRLSGPVPTGYKCGMPLERLNDAIQRTLPEARIEPVVLPDCGGIRLALINADFPIGPLDPEVTREVMRAPAYWAFCWGSGLALARLLRHEPGWVAGKTVVDLGSGSGIAAIAAALAGASRVTACDNDPDARLATTTNARFNGVDVIVTDTLPPTSDILLMADVLYDRDNLPLLGIARNHAAEVLVADSRVTEIPDPGYREVARIDALTWPNLGEFDEFKTAHIFHWSRS